MRLEFRRVFQILIVLFLGAIGYSTPSLLQGEFLDGVLGRLVEWENRGSPPSGALSFYTDAALVKAENGNIYEYDAQSSEWVEISVMEAEEFEDKASSSMWIIPTKKLKGTVDYYQGYEGYGILYSIILRDGTVVSYYEQGDDLTANLHAIIAAAIIGLRFVGGIIGLGSGLLFFHVLNRKRQRESTGISG